MKGLLIKDFKLLKMQRNFFLLILFISIGMVAYMENITFVFGYLMFIMSMFSLSTISYDEFDNGNSFLFTLPVSRRGYVVEKYIFSILLALGSWILSILISVISNSIRGTGDMSNVFIASQLILAVVFIFQALMIPLQIKFGSEKSRIAIIAVAGIVCIIGFCIMKAIEFLGIDVISFVNKLSSIGIEAIVLAAVTVAVFALIISIKISTFILNKKEF
ncbi:MAG: ABC-2 transporter permease [Lachnospira sp.]